MPTESHPPLPLLFCQRCDSLRLARVEARLPLSAIDENLAYTCITCDCAQRRTVRHAAGPDARWLCQGSTGPAQPGPPRGNRTFPVSCHACLRLLAQRLPVALGPSQAVCRGCGAVGPHPRWAEADAQGAEWVVYVCRACGQLRRLTGLNHALAPAKPPAGPQSRCGLGEAPGRKLLPTLGDVDCPECLAMAQVAGQVRPVANPSRKLNCAVCEAEREHAVSGLTLAGEEHLLLTCSACGESRGAGRLRHWRPRQGDLHPCGLRYGTWAVAKRLAQLTCMGCVQALLEQGMGQFTPDWRPEETIAEDHYAV